MQVLLLCSTFSLYLVLLYLGPFSGVEQDFKIGNPWSRFIRIFKLEYIISIPMSFFFLNWLCGSYHLESHLNNSYSPSFFTLHQLITIGTLESQFYFLFLANKKFRIKITIFGNLIKEAARGYFFHWKNLYCYELVGIGKILDGRPGASREQRRGKTKIKNKMKLKICIYSCYSDGLVVQ